MTCRFMNDVWRRCVINMHQLTNIGSDDQYAMGLEFHNGCRGNETIYRDRSPSQFLQLIVHGLPVRTTLVAQAALAQAGHVGVISPVLQVALVLTHDIPPHRLVKRGVMLIM